MRRYVVMLAALGGSLSIHAVLFWQTTNHTVKDLSWGSDDVPRYEHRVTIAFVDPAELKPKPPETEKPEKPRPPEPPEATKPEPRKPVDPPKVDPPKPDPKKPDPPKLPEEKPKPKPPEVEKFPDQIGEATGTGIGTHRSEGKEPLKARQGENDQAFLSRDPRGPGKINEDPSRIILAPGEDGTGGVAGRPEAAVVPAPAEPRPVPKVAIATPAQRPPSAVLSPLPGPVVVEPPEGAEQEPPERTTRLAQAGPAVPPPPAIAIPPLNIDPRSPAANPGETLGRGKVGVALEEKLPTEADAKFPTIVRRPTDVPGRIEQQPKPSEIPVPRIAPVSGTSPSREAWVPRPPMGVPLASPVQVTPPIIQPMLTAPPVVTPSGPPAPEAVASAADFPSPMPVPARPTPTPNPVTPTPQPGNGDGRKPGPAIHAADPAQESDSESDAFSRIGSFNAKDGRLDPQFGRKVKTVRPRVPIVGQIDAMSMKAPSVTLKVNIDATGKVTSVAIHKSSGSNEIDQPCLIAMYDWWFEPLKDKRGNPLPDTILFTISFK